ncbi:hypothetical protein BH10ACI2_BH10ACI2_00260 [soil metagenome]
MGNLQTSAAAQSRPAYLDFASRLRDAFDLAPNATIARRLSTSDATVKKYLDGERLPIPEMLLEITRVTGINLHWLLTGEGARRVGKSDDLFSEDERNAIRELATRSGRSFEDQVVALTMAAVEMVKKF